MRGGGGTDDLAQPAQVGRAPRGPTSRPDSRPPPPGVEAERGRLESVEGLFPRPAPLPHGCVLDRWARDRREVPGAPPARQLAGSTAVCFAPIPALLRHHGRSDAPAAVAFVGQIAREPRATGAGCRDQDAVLPRGRPLPAARGAITRPGPDCAQRADGRARVLGDRSDRAGRLMDIHADVERARRSQGGPPSLLACWCNIRWC